METLRLFWLIIKRVHGDKILYGFLSFFVLGSFLLWILDPDLHSWMDAIWLAYNIVTSIGLGDYTVTTFGARIVAILLGIYGAIITAFIPGMIASYYMEKVSFLRDETIEQYYDQLSHLSSMSQDQLRELSRKIREDHAK